MPTFALTLPDYMIEKLAILAGREGKSVEMCVTSPPYYGLRDYGIRSTRKLYPNRVRACAGKALAGLVVASLRGLDFRGE